MNTHESVRL